MSNLGKFTENARMALVALLSNKLRAVLTAIGIGIGIAAVIVLVSLGEAVQGYITRQFMGVGSDLITVRSAPPASGFGQRMGRAGVMLSSLTSKDVELLSDAGNVPYVKAIVSTVQVMGVAVNGSRYDQRAQTSGTTANYFDVLGRVLASGRLYDQDDLETAARVVILGQTAVKNLFATDANPIGETIKIGDVTFKVIGTLASSGSSTGMDQDDVIFMPITAAQTHLSTEKTGSGDLPITQVYLQATNMDVIDTVVSAATQVLRTQHKIKAGADNDFDVTAQKDMLESFQSTISMLTVFLAVIGGISLVVGGIGVMNIMLVTVTERTREIGLRKAVGARGWDVLLQFLTEALVLCFVGGAAGLTLSAVITYIIGVAVPTLEPSVSLIGITLAIGITTLIGVFFGMYPASRAAALSPIQALRAE